MKRIFAILFAAVLLVACAAPCFAATTDQELRDALAEHYKHIKQDLTSDNFTITEQHELSNETVAFVFNPAGWSMTDAGKMVVDKIGAYYCNGKFPYFYRGGEVYRGVKTAYDNGAVNDVVLTELAQVYPDAVSKTRPSYYHEGDEQETTPATPDAATPDSAGKSASGPAVKTGSANDMVILLGIGVLVFFAIVLRRRMIG